MKEPLTLAKEKKDQNKYYLNYPKPPALEIKLKNLDINVVDKDSKVWYARRYSDLSQTSRIIL